MKNGKENTAEAPIIRNMTGLPPKGELEHIDGARELEIEKALLRIKGVASAEADAGPRRGKKGQQAVRLRVMPEKRVTSETLIPEFYRVVRGFLVDPRYFADENGAVELT